MLRLVCNAVLLSVAAAECPGSCIDTSTTGCWTSTLTGYCSGASNIRCCPAQCSSVAGTCIESTTQSCSQSTLTGLCPGSSNIRCCPSGGGGARPFGPDVSHYQGNVNWASAKSAGIGFGIAKATEGTTYVDPYFATNRAGMKSAGIRVRGAYHFARPDNDAVTEAKHFVSAVGSFSAGEFAVLDIESAGSQSASSVASYCKTFANEVMSLTGLPKSRMWIYTGKYFWNDQVGGSSVVGDHPLWVASYTSASSPSIPSGWSQWTMWQYTDSESIAGCASSGVDASRFSGTQAQLESLVGLSMLNATAVV